LFLLFHKKNSMALFHLDEFESSRDALRRAVELFDEEQGEGKSGGKSASAAAKKWLQKAEAALGGGGGEEKEEGEAKAATSPPPPPAPAPAPRFRHQWFQTSDAVEVGVLAKGLKKEAVRVEVEPRRLLVVISEEEEEKKKEEGKEKASSSSSSSSLPLTSSSSSSFTLDLPLAGEVVPGKCRHAVLSTKVEIRLHKAVPGTAWPSLEAGKEAKKEAPSSAAAPLPLAPPLASAPAPADKASTSSASASIKKPAYPSSNPKHTNWDELDRKLEAEEAAEDEGEGAPEGEEALMKLFQNIYGDGDDDVRRAMSKSFLESKGEVLSTSWKDVSVGKMPGEECCEEEGCGSGGGSCGHEHHKH